jgi:lantibiotic modifying enzyme
MVEAGLRIATELAATSVENDGGWTWHAQVVVGAADDGPLLGYGDVGPTLYDGSAGIAYALAGAIPAAEPRLAELLRQRSIGAARHALSASHGLLDDGRLGLFDGATGVALAAAAVGEALADRDLTAQATTLAAAIADRLAAQATARTVVAELDLLSGVAGTLLGLLTLPKAVPVEPLSVAEAAACLADAAIPQQWGVGWPSAAQAPDGPPLLGLGHGAAGVALALAEMAVGAAGPRSDGKEPDTLRAVSAQGVAYERSWFDAEQTAWPDLRETAEGDPPRGWMAAWCHGAIGIGLSRLRLFRLIGDSPLLVDASAALQAGRNLTVAAGTALHAGRSSDCSACHGLAGVLELFLVAGAALGVPAHRAAARRVAQLLLEQHGLEGRWPCGIAGAGELPGLMTGTAGIALALLRAAGATELPTPLLPGPAGW